MGSSETAASSSTAVGTGWTELGSVTLDSTNRDGFVVQLSAKNETGSLQNIFARVKVVGDSTFYIPDSDGIEFYQVADDDPINTTFVIPGNLDGATVSIEMYAESDAGSIGWSMGFTNMVGHTHPMTTSFGVYEETLSTPSVVVTAGADGSETEVIGTYTSVADPYVDDQDQKNLNITTQISGVSAGEWASIKFVPNKNMRIEANAHVKLFIESK